MEFLQDYLDMWRNYANFRGRTTRRGYWVAVLFNVIAGIAWTMIIGMLGVLHLDSIAGLLYSIYAFAIIIPNLSMAVRRLHDIGKSGIYYLFVLIPLAGPIILLVWLCSAGNPDHNAYGPPAPGAGAGSGF